MEKIVLAFLASAALFGSVRAVCDNSTASKIGECIFESALLDPEKIPQNENDVTTYCSDNATNKCVETNMADCSEDQRQMDLMKSMATPEKITAGQMYLCTNKTALEKNYDCLQDFTKSDFLDCAKAAVGVITNAGDMEDLKTRLDTTCTFFNSYAMCFEKVAPNCKEVVQNVFKTAVNGLKYAYCDMDDMGKKKVISDYTAVGSSAVLTGSVLTILTAYLVSVAY